MQGMRLMGSTIQRNPRELGRRKGWL